MNKTIIMTEFLLATAVVWIIVLGGWYWICGKMDEKHRTPSKPRIIQ